MSRLSLRHLYKVYSQGGVKAVSDFSMEIDDNEFIVFVGPSGCGKSTTLRMIAGLEEITAGEILIDGKVVNGVQPKDRDIAMVFQNYALYPHMSAFNNMAFGLRLKKMPEDEIVKRVNEVAEILDIQDLLERKPKNMSGGQRQRVALGRAIVRHPKVFLLDEPLSNLDAKLRTQMRIEITKLHERLATTFIYVTHDQVEAMTMGSRIVVMKDGFVQQIDTPQNLYDYPLNKFVAGFIGTPQMNFYSGTMEKQGDSIVFVIADGRRIEYNAALFEKIAPSYLTSQKDIILGIRPEDIVIDGSCNKLYPSAVLSCKISVVEKLGSEVLLYGDMDFASKSLVSQSPSGITIKTDNKNEVAKDDEIEFVLDPKRICLFDADTEKAIIERIPKFNHIQVSIKGDTMQLCSYPFELPPSLKGAVKEGEYTAIISNDAFLFGSEGAPVGGYSEETVQGERLIRFTFQDNAIFAIAPKAAKITSFDLDMTKIKLYDSKGDMALASMTKQNFLKGVFAKDKKPFKQLLNFNNETYSFIIEGEKVACPEHIAARLAYALARMAFDKQLGFVFEISDILFEKGDDCLVLPIMVKEILDYGKDKIAKIVHNKIELLAKVTDQNIGQHDIYIPWSKITIYDLETKTRII